MAPVWSPWAAPAAQQPQSKRRQEKDHRQLEQPIHEEAWATMPATVVHPRSTPTARPAFIREGSRWLRRDRRGRYSRPDFSHRRYRDTDMAIPTTVGQHGKQRHHPQTNCEKA